MGHGRRGGPLEDLVVLDFTWALSGPYATMVLADLGARVIKVEMPGRGDFARENGPFVNGLGTYFASISRGKESLTVNLKHPEGKKLVLALARRADVVVQNFVPGTMENLGLGYDVLRAENPRLIYASCSGFGQTGPYRERPALDIIVQAMAGTMSVTGEPGRPPTRVGYSVGDIGASLFLAVGILAAAHERARSGEGQHVDVAMLDSQVAMLENAFIRYLAAGEVPGPLGTDHPVITPFGGYRAKDGYLALAASKDPHWRIVCDVVGHPEWKDDPRFASLAQRNEHRAVIRQLLEAVLGARPRAEWIEAFLKAGIPCGPVSSVPEAAADPQVHARGMIVEVPHPNGGTIRMAGTPVKLSRTPARVEDPPPTVGQHTEAILAEFLGLGAAEVARLRAAGAV